MSAQLAMFGVNALMGLGSGWLAKEQAKNQNTVNSANVYASNLMRGANNELASKRDSLSRYIQATNNQRVMDNAGDMVNANVTNYLRTRDELDDSDLESQIAYMEQAGAQAAAGAASGLVGGAVDMVAGTMALRESRRQGKVEKVRGQVKVDFAEAQRQSYLAAISRTDQSDIMTNIDYSVDVFVPQKRQGSWFTDVMSGQSAGTLSAAAGAASGAFKSAQSFAFKPQPPLESFYGVR